MSFIDLERAFENVDWNKLFLMLRNVGLKYRDGRTIASICKD